MLGAFSYALQTSRKRLLRSDVLISVDGTQDTPPALARDYLTLKYGKAGRVTWPQVKRLKETARPLPLFIKPTTFDEGYYIDVRAAYWQIMQIVGWQVDYYPGRWLMRGPGVRDFPYREDKRPQKMARNCLVSAGQKGGLLRWMAGPKTTQEVNAGNRLINGQLVGLVHDVLHAIAVQAQRAGVVYVATDGYVAPTMRIAQRVGRILEDWGLEARLKGAGGGGVYGAGAYTVGRLRSRAPRSGQPVANLEPGEYDRWLQPRFEALSALRDRPD
jgi:hypothetical protein